MIQISRSIFARYQKIQQPFILGAPIERPNSKFGKNYALNALSEINYLSEMYNFNTVCHSGTNTFTRLFGIQIYSLRRVCFLAEYDLLGWRVFLSFNPR
jgi:hypothetical protein